MNRDELSHALEIVGYPPDSADDVVWLANDADDLTDYCPYNFVPISEGMFEILQPDGRAGYFPAKVGDEPFVGTLDEAYEWIFLHEKHRFEQRSRRNRPSA